tara:strand:- start:640 stop:816 length:177 start_codon:yes stop_codon:yes gene_type:complete
MERRKARFIKDPKGEEERQKRRLEKKKRHHEKHHANRGKERDNRSKFIATEDLDQEAL